MDTDTLFISPIHEIWQQFSKFNASQIVGMSSENEHTGASWYNSHTDFPHYGLLGLNSGVMLMNLTRMRSFQWNTYMWPLLRDFKRKIELGDQDLINILFHNHTHRVYLLPCAFNYRPEPCNHEDACRVPDGIQVLHGKCEPFQIGILEYVCSYLSCVQRL